MIDFSDKVLVMSGANGGITRAIARAFFDRGAAMVLTDLDEAGVRAFASDLDESGARVVAAKADVTQSAGAEATIALCKDKFGHADFLVTGAGLYLDRPVEAMTDAQWRETIAINLDGVFYFCRAIQPILRDGGAIVNIASMAAHRGSFHHAHYSAAKGGVLSLTRSLAVEFAGRNIRVNAVSPGLIDTPLIASLLKLRGDQLMDATPLHRLGRPEEVANVILFLCSDLASFITAETIHINGGLYVQ